MRKYMVISLAILIFISNNILYDNNSDVDTVSEAFNMEVPLIPNQKLNYVESGIINIDGNNEFLSTASANSWLSLGTVVSPIIISNINITGLGYDYLFAIRNTDLYFRIEYSLFSNSYIGIYLVNASYSLIQHNYFNENDVGIFLDSSDNFFIQNNTVQNSIEIGIGVSESTGDI